MCKLNSNITKPNIKLISGLALDYEVISKLLELKNDTVEVNIIPNCEVTRFNSAIAVALNVGLNFSRVYEIPRLGNASEYHLLIDGKLVTAKTADDKIEEIKDKIEEMKGAQ